MVRRLPRRLRPRRSWPAVLNAVIFLRPRPGHSRSAASTSGGRSCSRRRRDRRVLAHRRRSAPQRDRLAASLDEIGVHGRRLERRDERLELVLAASGTGFWDWDIRSGALTWSDAIFTQHGLDPTAGSPTFESYVQTIHPDDRDPFQRARPGDRRLGRYVQARVPDPVAGRLRPLDLGCRPGLPRRRRAAHPDDRHGHRHHRARRLEAQRDGLLEDERRAGSFREAFIDVISHELRTPITTIFGLTRIIQRARPRRRPGGAGRPHRRHRGRIGAVGPPRRGPRRADPRGTRRVRGRGRAARAAPAARPRRRHGADGACPA